MGVMLGLIYIAARQKGNRFRWIGLYPEHDYPWKAPLPRTIG